MEVLCVRAMKEAINCKDGTRTDLSLFKLPAVGSSYVVIEVIEKPYGVYYALDGFMPTQHFNSTAFAQLSDLDEKVIHAEHLVKTVTPCDYYFKDMLRQYNCRCITNPSDE